MDTVAINKLQYLLIGQQGENAANNIPIDMTEWVNEFPNTRFHLLFKAYNTQSPLPMVTTYDAETHILTWTPTLDATQNAGVGYTEVRALDHENGVLKKSRIIPTTVENSVTGVEGGTVPEPYEDWVNLVLGYKDAAEDAQEAAETAQGLAEDAQEAAETAQGKAEDAEDQANAWATGQIDGSDVPDTDPQYHNNAKYYSQQASDSATEAAASEDTAAQWATGGSSGTPGATNNSKYFSEQSASSATDASDAKDAAIAAKNALQGATAEATTLQPGSQATAELVWDGGVAGFSFGIPRGADGMGSVTGVKMNDTQYNPDSQGIVNVGTVITDKSDKTDKVNGAVTGNFAGLDANGNLTDSGKKASDFAVPASTVSVTAAAGSWTGADLPEQTISVTGVTASNLIFVALDAEADLDEVDAFSAGQIRCTEQAAGTITLTCFGREPQINIPITVAIVG